MKNYLMLIVVAALPVLTQAQAYHNVVGISELRLRSTEGMNVTLTAKDFESNNTQGLKLNTASQIQIAVNGTNIEDSTRAIRAVLMSNCASDEGVVDASISADLRSDNNSGLKFIGEFPGTVTTHITTKEGKSIQCQPELSIVVDGVWQTDPVNGSHNFNLMNF